MAVSDSAIRILDLLRTKPCYVREVSEELGSSTRTVVKWLKEFERMGIVERGASARPKIYCLTMDGWELDKLFKWLRYKKLLRVLHENGFKVSAGPALSMVHWGAPIVIPRLDFAAETGRLEEVKKVLGEVRFEVVGLPFRGCFERLVFDYGGVPYMSLEDTVIFIIIKNDARSISCVPVMLSKNKVDYNLLYMLSLEHKKVREVGALLEVTNKLADEEKVPMYMIEKFYLSAKETRIGTRLKAPHKFVVAGIVPRTRHVIRKRIEERWGVKIPTIQEMAETFELGEAKLGSRRRS